jgi:hypothetical protein
MRKSKLTSKGRRLGHVLPVGLGSILLTDTTSSAKVSVVSSGIRDSSDPGTRSGNLC